MSTARATGMKSTSFKCTNCGKEFATEELFQSHKEMDHLKHIPLAGVG